MALKDILKLVDDKLADTFNKKAFDPAKDRKSFGKHIDTTANQFASATPVKGRKSFSIKNGVVEYKPPVPIEGRSTLYVPSGRFGDFLTGLKSSVEAGDLDSAFEARFNAGGFETGGGAPKRKRAGWSPERRAAHAAAQAAKKK